ncbi:MAG: glycosyltransferase [Anaerolineae bacterium]|nr:glycosyltransferase [Anaerolineae bacterium]
MTISVIVPAHNAAGYLRHSLPALQRSIYPALECIVVDDASTDDTAAVCQAFAVQRVGLTGAPHGPATARNRGAAVSQGDILLFLDADVVLRPETLSRLAATFQNETTVAAIFGSYDDRPLATNFVSQAKNLLHHFTHQQARPDATTFWAGCGAIRRPAWQAVGGFDEQRYRRPSIEDIELGYRLTAAGYPIRLDKGLLVTHIKRWTMLSLLRSDVRDRAWPWAWLALERRRLPNDLNSHTSQRVSALLTWGIVGSVAGAWLRARRRPASPPAFAQQIAPPAWLTGLGACAGVIWLNRSLYRFLWRQRGFGFALAFVPLHLLYYLYSTTTFGLAALAWRAQKH